MTSSVTPLPSRPRRVNVLSDRMLMPKEVANLFRVDSKTVVRWANAGRFPAGVVVKTPGGHTRFLESGVTKMLEELTGE